MVCTQTCPRRVRKEEEPGKGLEAIGEANLTYRHIHEAVHPENAIRPLRGVMSRHLQRMVCERNQGKRRRSGTRDAILDGWRRPDTFRASTTRGER